MHAVKYSASVRNNLYRLKIDTNLPGCQVVVFTPVSGHGDLHIFYFVLWRLTLPVHLQKLIQVIDFN